MDIIEFLEHTDQRNLKFRIDYLVKQKLNELNDQLEERRARLRQLLDSESRQYEQERASLQQACVDDKFARRMEWIGLMRLNRERCEEELLKMKQQQKELEMSEEFKQIRSREMLMESKQAQLYQIEEKKQLKEKENRVDRYWFNAMQTYSAEKGLYEFKEQKLRKFIADLDQQKNLEQTNACKTKAQIEAEALRLAFEEDNIRASNIDKKHKKDAQFYEWRKKVHCKDVLERQISENAVNKALELQVASVNANLERKQNQQTILEEIDKEGAEMIKNRAFQKEYLEHTFQEKESLREKDKALEHLLIGTGCVLEQKEKRPYSKMTR